jgi:hypothetical protein
MVEQRENSVFLSAALPITLTYLSMDFLSPASYLLG